MSAAKTTTDHKVIQTWIESRNGCPAVVAGTEGKDGEGILRVEFREAGKLEHLPWDEFFKTFDDRKLAFLYQEETSDGSESRFFKFVKRDEHAGAH